MSAPNKPSDSREPLSDMEQRHRQFFAHGDSGSASNGRLLSLPKLIAATLTLVAVLLGALWLASRPTKMSFVLIRPGTFRMGSDAGDPDELPIHDVIISRPFFLGTHEVTQREYRDVMNTPAGDAQAVDSQPAAFISWFDAIRFCNALSVLEGAPPYYTLTPHGDVLAVTIPDLEGNGYRLPTEAEWEFACRAGTTTDYSFGRSTQPLTAHAWYAANSGNQAHPVGHRAPNDFGLHDMHGNVWEWCWDPYDPHAYGDHTPEGRTFDRPDSPLRVARGGSFDSDAPDLRSANRVKAAPADRFSGIGFRVARNAPTPPG